MIRRCLARAARLLQLAVGQVNEAMVSWRAAVALRHALGDGLGEGEDLRRLSLVLWPRRGPRATEAGRASVRILEQVGPSAQLAWALVNMAQLPPRATARI